MKARLKYISMFGELVKGWDVVTLDSICEVKGGKRLPKESSLVTENTGYPYIRVTDMYMGGISTNNIHYIPANIAPKLKTYRISKDDLFIVVVGATIGTVGEVPEALHNANLTENADKLTNIQIDKIFLHYVLQSHIIQGLIKNQITINAQPKLALTRIRKFLIPLPSSNEQRRIAEILSTWDEAIRLTKRLIATKQTRKKGLMQQLLTGKIRFGDNRDSQPFYSTPFGKIPRNWKISTLNNIFKMSSGSTPSRRYPNYFEGDILWVTSGELNYGIISNTTEKITEEAIKATSLTVHPKGTFMLAITGLEAAGTRGRCGILGKPAAISQSCMAFEKNDEVDTNYLFYFYNCFSEHIAFKYAQGTKQQSLPKKILGLVPIFYPLLEEQRRIAAVLQTCDAEIELLRRKLSALQRQKRGLMQQLLTGRVRVTP